MKLRALLFFTALLALPLLAVAQSVQLITVSPPTQPSNGTALPNTTVAAVAINLAAGNAPVTITGLFIEKVGSAADGAVASIDVRDSATNILATGNLSNSKATLPISLSLAAGERKTLLVSAKTAGDLLAYQGQFFELNITGLSTGAVISGALPMYGAQYTLNTGINKPTCSLTANPGIYTVGQTVLLSWNSAGATSGNITGLGNVNLRGAQGILPSGTATYTATFTGPGGTGTCSVTVTRSTNGVSGGVATGGTVLPPGTVSPPGTVPTPGSTGSNVGTDGKPVTFDPRTQPSTGVNNGLVPCNGVDCRACDLAPLAQRIINILVGLSIPLAAVMFAWAGMLYFTSAANPSGIEKARKVFMVVFWGVVVAITGWLIIQTILYTVLTPQVYQSWNSIKCPSAARPTNENPANWFSQALGNLNTNALPPVSVGGDSVLSGNGSAGWSTSYTSGSCTGAGYYYDTEADNCYNPDTGGTQEPTPLTAGTLQGLGNIRGVTAYDPGFGGNNGADIGSRNNPLYTVQDCISASYNNCNPISVATSQASGIQFGTEFTWPELVQRYNQTYGLSLPLDTRFQVADVYEVGYGNGTFDVSRCARHNSGCFVTPDTQATGNFGCQQNSSRCTALPPPTPLPR